VKAAAWSLEQRDSAPLQKIAVFDPFSALAGVGSTQKSKFRRVDELFIGW
jgi:hypothetical protein